MWYRHDDPPGRTEPDNRLSAHAGGTVKQPAAGPDGTSSAR